MALKLILEKGDKVMCAEVGMMVDVLFVGKDKVQLAFDAPKDITINAVFADSSKMFKNKKKAAE
jgi:sRNA-binding carbon storage regulator CsrA